MLFPVTDQQINARFFARLDEAQLSILDPIAIKRTHISKSRAGYGPSHLMKLVHCIELTFIAAQKPVMKGAGDCDINFVHSAVRLLVRRDYQINNFKKQKE